MALVALDSFETWLSSVAETTGSLLVASLPVTPDKTSLPEVRIEIDAFERYLTALRPRVIYYGFTTFDARETAEDQLGVDFGDEDGASDVAQQPALKAFLARWRKHDGERDLAIAQFVADGVAHVALIEAPWRDAATAAAEALEVQLAEVVAEARHQGIEAVDQETHALAVRLSQHPAFSAPRASKEKRTYLAETLFPELARHKLWTVVDRATNIAWLRDIENVDD